MIKVAVIDREALYIDIVMQTLAHQPDIDAIAGVSMYEDFVEPARQADIALILSERVVATTRALIQTVRHDAPQAAIVVMRAPSNEPTIIDFLAAGAVGYVRESDDAEYMLNVIRVVANGEALAHPELIRPLYATLADMSDRLRALAGGRGASIANLTPRQREVCELLAAGRSNDEIAAQLAISTGTVKNHIHQILQTLQARDRQVVAELFKQFHDVAE